MSVRRVTAAGAQVEYKLDDIRRVTAAGAQVEYKLDDIRRVTAAGIMVEYTIPAATTARTQMPAVQVV